MAAAPIISSGRRFSLVVNSSPPCTNSHCSLLPVSSRTWVDIPQAEGFKVSFENSGPEPRHKRQFRHAESERSGAEALPKFDHRRRSRSKIIILRLAAPSIISSGSSLLVKPLYDADNEPWKETDTRRGDFQLQRE